MWSEPRAREGPLLRVGTAGALLIEGVPDDPAVRTAVAQARLRQATGRTDIVITRRSSGRPRLEAPYPELGVSLSHRGDVLIVAFCPDAAVGCDVETADPSLDVVRLSSDHFAPAEAKAISQLSSEAARDLFLLCWVAKEAILKVSGRGVHDGLDEPDLSACFDSLTEEREFRCAAGARSPAVRLVVRRFLRGDRPAIYCALAVADQ